MQISRRRFLCRSSQAAALAAWPDLSFALAAEDRTEAEAQRGDNLNLRGDWRFCRDDDKRGIAERWYSGALPASVGRQTIPLPGTTDEADAGHRNTEKPTLAGLYRENIYVGPAWYQREIEVPEAWGGKWLQLYLERVHWVTHAWLDGRPLGTRNSLVAPHVYDLGTDVPVGKHLLTLCVDNTIQFDLGRFVSVLYEGTQTNWNGIVGRIELQARDAVHVAGVRVFPDIDQKLARVEVSLRNASPRKVHAAVQIVIRDRQEEAVGRGSLRMRAEAGQTSVEQADVAMGPGVELWDEFSPYLYSTEISVEGSSAAPERAMFGMRQFGARGRQFVLNGRPLMLRGTLECGIFPLTGCPPTDVDAWRRIFQIERSYGLNFIRFHSWTPPKAAFEAADLEGVFIHTEGPQANVPTGVVPERDAFVREELLRIVDTYGNHPSFALMAIGNEFGGSAEVVTGWVEDLRQRDSRHLYTSATSNRLKAPNRQWTEDATMRGVHGPGTTFTYDDTMAKEQHPFVGHEIGQWTFFPDLDEARKYTGVLKAENFEIVRSDLRAKGMLDQARLFLEATGKQALLLYKDEIECILRTRDYAGFSLLDIHDYPGQGTALIGFLDAFWDSKGLLAPEDHSAYAGPTVPLARFPKRTYWMGERVDVQLDLTHFGPRALENAEPVWQLASADGEVLASGTLPSRSVKTGQLSELGTFSVTVPTLARPTELILSTSIKNSAYRNSWHWWAYSKGMQPPEPPAEALVCRTWADAETALSQGKTVLLLPSRFRKGTTLKGSFKPVFWSPVWFVSDPATMGVLVNPDHPLFRLFPTDLHSDWQWWSLVEGSESVILDACPLEYRPLVQVIDNFSRNHRLGTVFEAKVGEGRLLVCTLQVNHGAPDRQTPEQHAMMMSLFAYLSSPMFAPKQALTPQLFASMFEDA